MPTPLLHFSLLSNAIPSLLELSWSLSYLLPPPFPLIHNRIYILVLGGRKNKKPVFQMLLSLLLPSQGQR